MRESVIALLPIFLIFVVTHVLAVTYGLFTHLADLPATRRDERHRGSRRAAERRIRICAVPPAAGLQYGRGHVDRDRGRFERHALAEGAAGATGKRTMAYMAISLAFLAGDDSVQLFPVQRSPGAGADAERGAV